MTPWLPSSGCKAVDISRSCFACKKWVHFPDGTVAQVPGQYYFLPDHAEFLGRSLLGGPWWEGRPYQDPGGELATVDGSAHWIDGAPPPKPPFGSTCTPCSAIATATITSATFNLRDNDGKEQTTALGPPFPAPPDLEWDWIDDPIIGFRNEWLLNPSTCSARFKNDSFDSFHGSDRTLWEPGQAADYLGTWQWDSQFAWWADFVLRPSRIRLRVFGHP